MIQPEEGKKTKFAQTQIEKIPKTAEFLNSFPCASLEPQK